MALINMFWKKYGLEAVNQWMINACTIEVVLILEQMLNYGHTGNAAVLMKWLMDQVWFSLGLINNGSWSIADGGHNGATAIMASGSRDALTDDVVKAVTATDIWGSTLQDMDQGPQLWEVACYTRDVTFQVYFEDMKKLVHSRLSSKLTPQLGSPNFAVITEPANGKFKLMTSVLGKKPMTFIADVMIKQCSQAGNQNQPPFIKGGNFLQVAWVAIKEMGKAVWLNLGAKAAPLMNTHLTIYPTQQLNASLACQASKDIQAGNACGDWVNWLMEWEMSNIKGGGMPEYIVDAYCYIQNMYDGMKPLHQLAMICAVICQGDQCIPSGLAWIGVNQLCGQILISQVEQRQLNSDQIKERHVEVVRLMRTRGKYGGFDSVWYLAGMNVVRILVMNHYVTLHTLPMTNIGGSLLKQVMREWDGDDGVVELSCKNDGVETVGKQIHLTHTPKTERWKWNQELCKIIPNENARNWALEVWIVQDATQHVVLGNKGR
ncbi:hypothetical protein BKA83DRAFT_4122809 [Pisolithus microcarpus]|nr:hypothetical protein BKA83DRAFT_4122809 [Pisolithus microcarpus]